MDVKIQLEDGAKIPTKAHKTDGGWDLYANEDVIIYTGKRYAVNTGIHIGIPEGWCAIVYGRGGVSAKEGMDILAGVIDYGYTGPVKVCLDNTNPVVLGTESDGEDGSNISYILDRRSNHFKVNKGDRIAQMVFHEVPDISFVEEELEESERGEKGWGSSGK